MKEKGQWLPKLSQVPKLITLESSSGRRNFMKLIGLASIAGAAALLTNDREGYYDTAFRVELSGKEKLTFEDACAIAKRIDRCTDQLPDVKVPIDDKELIKWVIEMIPNFEAEGAVDIPRYPENVAFVIYKTADRHIHTAGQSDCSKFAVLNARYVNSVTSDYGKDEYLFTLLHELAHVQQGNSCNEDRTLVEATAQIVALEVGASLINQGNRTLLRPVLQELKNIFIGTAYSVALRDGRMEEFKRYRKTITSSAFREAAFEHSIREWESEQWRLEQILERYEEMPANKIVSAITKDHNIIRDLALSPMGGAKRPFIIDDLNYLITYMEDLTSEAASG